MTMIADSYADPVFFNAELAEQEPVDPVGHFLRDLGNLAEELNDTTLTPEACDKWLARSNELLLTVSTLNIACHRITDRCRATRINRRLVEIA